MKNLYGIMQNIILIGFMGSGKTTVGKILAERLGIELIDTDKWIEQKQKISIKDIFAIHGEDYFRLLETELLKALCDTDEMKIIATGGGMPLREENQLLLQKMGNIVYLKADAETIYKRIRNDKNRPLLQTPDPKLKITELLSERTPIYEKIAEITIDTNNKTLNQVVDEILVDLR